MPVGKPRHAHRRTSADVGRNECRKEQLPGKAPAADKKVRCPLDVLSNTVAEQNQEKSITNNDNKIGVHNVTFPR